MPVYGTSWYGCALLQIVQLYYCNTVSPRFVCDIVALGKPTNVNTEKAQSETYVMTSPP